MSLFVHQSWAQSPDSSTINLQVPTKIESTNIKTEGYIWQFELHADPDTQTVTAKLLNPHPQLKQLNQRAVDIANQVQFKQLKDLYTTQQTQPSAPQRTTALSSKERFKFEIKFINYMGYEKRPSRRLSGDLAYELCELSLTQPKYAQFYDVESNTISMTIDLTVSSNGNIQSYAIFNHNKQPMNLPEVTQLLTQYKFYSINKNGQPFQFRVTQPFQMNCPIAYKNHYDEMKKTPN